MNSKVKTLLILSALTMELASFGIGTQAGGQGKGERATGKAVYTYGIRKRRRVADNETYVVLNKKGERTREYGPGEEMPDDGSCVEIECPSNIKDAGRGKTIRCWRCRQVAQRTSDASEGRRRR